jgi:hypothetical protein
LKLISFVYGAHYSIACRLGELGNVHHSQVLAVITEEQFEKAKATNWDVEINFLWGGNPPLSFSYFNKG